MKHTTIKQHNILPIKTQNVNAKIEKNLKHLKQTQNTSLEHRIEESKITGKKIQHKYKSAG